ncbi:hypothetical protein NCCP2716_18610 [Sporosarcina sp. NCCP-2716]|nr:hypothetical protein NCCP2716_18610 [Sporosarcina sp. NCCP-2716]
MGETEGKPGEPVPAGNRYLCVTQFRHYSDNRDASEKPGTL